MNGIHSLSIAILPSLLVCCQHTLEIFQYKKAPSSIWLGCFCMKTFFFVPEIRLSGLHLLQAANVNHNHLHQVIIFLFITKRLTR